LVQIGDDDQSVPPKASERAGVAGRAEIKHYPADHFDVYPGQVAHDDVLRDQLVFLRRVLGPQGATSAAGDPAAPPHSD
jgi:hypothetical protein